MKILIVRFSSIGDIVLTTPVVRCLKQQIPGVRLHYLTKKKFEGILVPNPYLDKIYCIDKKVSELRSVLKEEKYDYIIDLHHNIRTLKLKNTLKVKSYSFPKLNIKKWLLVRFKLNQMPAVHVVDRYFETVRALHVTNDQLPCDFFIPQHDEIDVQTKFGFSHYVSVAIGAQFATKRLPNEKLVEILQQIELPVVLLGDRNDRKNADMIVEQLRNKTLVNCCGEINLNQSASVVKQSAVLLTHDTGLMHIASAFQTRVVSVWGNTTPDFGMYPYFPSKKESYSIHEVSQLSCRPCSKIGFQSCPKKHFNCMKLQNAQEIANDMTSKAQASV